MSEQIYKLESEAELIITVKRITVQALGGFKRDVTNNNLEFDTSLIFEDKAVVEKSGTTLVFQTKGRLQALSTNV